MVGKGYYKPRKTMVKVVQDEDGEILGVVTDDYKLKTGRIKGIKTLSFELNAMQKVGTYDKPWVVYFNRADIDRPHVWPLHGFPKESGPVVLSEGIEYVTYAEDAAKAVERVFSQLQLESWDTAVAEWEA